MRTGKYLLDLVAWRLLASCFSGQWQQKLCNHELRSEWEVKNASKFSKEKRREMWAEEVFSSCSFGLAFLFFYFIALQKRCKNSREFQYALHPLSPSVNILYNHGVIINVKKVMVQRY